MLFGAVIVPLAISEWTSTRIAFAVVWVAFWILATFAVYDVRRFWWATRSVTGVIFASYAGYLIYEWFFSNDPFVLSQSRAEASPRNALFGFFLVGLPCLYYTLFGRTTLKPDKETQTNVKRKTEHET